EPVAQQAISAAQIVSQRTMMFPPFKSTRTVLVAAAGARRGWRDGRRQNVNVLELLAILGIHRLGTAEHRFERNVVLLRDLVQRRMLAGQIARRDRRVLVQPRELLDRL